MNEIVFRISQKSKHDQISNKPDEGRGRRSS